MTSQNYSGLYMALEQKNSLLEEYEQITSAMLSCDTEYAEAYIEKREQLMQKMQQIKTEIDRFKALFKPQEQLFEAALKNNCGRDTLSSELKKVYDYSQAAFSYAHRIMMYDEQITQRLCDERDDLREKIAQTEKSNTPQLVGYYKAMSADITSGALLGDNKKV